MWDISHIIGFDLFVTLAMLAWIGLAAYLARDI
jgi:hypothetical protein